MRRLLVFLFALGLAACSGLPLDARAPTLSVAEVDLKHLGLLEQRFDVSLRVANPNDFDLRIEALEFEIEVNGRPFASGLSRVSTLIPATSTALLQVDAYTRSKNLIRQIETLSPGTLKAGVPYRIYGRVKTGHASRWLPFDHSGVYGGDDKPARGRAV